MKDFFSWFNDIPAKAFHVLSIIGMVYFFGKNYVSFAFHPDVQKFAVPLFVFSIGYTAYSVLAFLWKAIKSFFLSFSHKKKYRKIIKDLNEFERIIICEFYLENRNALNLPWEDSVIQGLVDRRILLYANNIIDGFDRLFKINPVLRAVIDPEKDLSITQYRELRKNHDRQNIRIGL